MTPARLALALPVLLMLAAWLWNAEVRGPITILGNVHGLGTCDLSVAVRTDGGFYRDLAPAEFVCDPKTGDVTVLTTAENVRLSRTRRTAGTWTYIQERNPPPTLWQRLKAWNAEVRLP